MLAATAAAAAAAEIAAAGVDATGAEAVTARDAYVASLKATSKLERAETRITDAERQV